jgi:hypothetical protein
MARIEPGPLKWQPVNCGSLYLADNIKMNLKEVKCEGMEWTHLAQYRTQWRAVVNTVSKPLVPHKEGNCVPAERSQFPRKVSSPWRETGSIK